MVYHVYMRPVDFTDHVCKVCGRSCPHRRSFGNHVNRSHKDLFPSGIRDYVVKYYLEGVEPLCRCGCGAPVRWHPTQYTFSDYLSGHNPGGFSTDNQPPVTEETRRKRSASMNAYYAREGERAKQKISEGIMRTRATDGGAYSRKLSDALRRRWSDPGQREHLTEERQRVWDEHGDDLRRRIFTPEFGRKISAANARRDMKHTSKEEARFVDHLRAVLGSDDVIASKWINLAERSLCPDVYIPSKGVYVEFDGVYWHGLDRSSGWKQSQVVHMTNDIEKNRLAREGHFDLMRVRSDIDLSSINSWEDLVSVAYHVCIGGEVLLEGTLRLDDDTPLLTREELIRTNETSLFPDAPGREHTEKSILPLVMRFLREHVAYWGWFYPSSADTTTSVMSALSSAPVSPIEELDFNSSLGNVWLKARFASYWDVDGGPMQSFHDDALLEKVLRYRLGLNNSRLYSYTLSDGSRVDCHETFDISFKNVRFGFVVQRHAVSFFRPLAARDVYAALAVSSDPGRGPRVWDPSAGFGARMLGFFAAHGKRGGEYWATEPARATFTDLTSLRDELIAQFPLVSVELADCGSEVVELPTGYFDLVFTSPPYFDKERYYDEPGQCWRGVSSRGEWVERYLLPTYKTAYGALRSGGRMAINFDEECTDLSRGAAERAGFVHEKRIEIALRKDHYTRARGGKRKPEYLDVFRKS